MKEPTVYILASRFNGTLYVGVTSDLTRRAWEHRHCVQDGFTAKHGVKHLVYFETHGTMADAITREKRVKKWRREWKIALIERGNPLWRDLYQEIVNGDDGSPLSRG